jgi:hypothetical protein
MAAANRAMRQGDLSALVRLISDERDRPDAVVGSDVGAELVRVIRRITQVRRRLAELQDQEAALRGDSLWQLLERVRQEPHTLEEVEADLHAQIASAGARLKALNRA